MGEKENVVQSPEEKIISSTPLPEVKTISGTNINNLLSPQIASLRLKPVQSTDSPHHPLLNYDDEESDMPRFSSHPVPGGSVGGLMLVKLREMNVGFSDIVQMLIAKKVGDCMSFGFWWKAFTYCGISVSSFTATLFLPASSVMPFENVDRTYLEDHIIFSQSTEDGIKVVTLNGVRGFIQQDVFKAIGLMPTEQEFDIDNPKSRKSIFDTFSKPADLSFDYPTIKILNNNADILLHGMPIQTIVIESPVRTKEISERIATRTEMEEKVKGSYLPEALLKEIENFIRDFMKDPPKNEDASFEQIQGLFDHVRCEIECQVVELTEVSENRIDETMNIVENYVCMALYDNIFSPKWSNDVADDEALGSKIAALNLLELGLSNLGVDIKSQQQQEFIDLAIQVAGAELQSLEQKKAPYEKLNSLIHCHGIVVEALEKKIQPPQDSTNIDLANYKSALNQSSYSVSNDISPASIPLPPSPTLSKSSVVPITPISPKLPMTPTLPTSPTDEKHSTGDPNADAILPLLIFIVVKSNPKKLISNLRFMRRYRVNNLLCGEAAYCLTNIEAAVLYLVNEDFPALGLLPDKPLSNTNPGLEQRVTRRVGQDIVDVADTGFKVITGVMDSSVKMFGRLIGYENTSIGTNSPSIAGKGKESPIIPEKNDVNDNKMNSGMPEEGPSKELAEINAVKYNIRSEENSSSNNNQYKNFQLDENKSLTGRLLPFNVLPRFNSDRNHIDEEENKRSMVNEPVNKISPPIQKFLDCSIEEFRVNDVPELLEDYKRLANAVRDLGFFS
ncbi:1611_t:CDS:10 [Funneliformis caledonium]|uniref:1611_t:CDS:1 n=1 Tax=Funneliformis caledonium TaxID=1117310 RepID=A0A9N8V1L6_9GLOM|nr:1611_t:CDS:10 [Funneliformis caledonium]